MNLSRRLRMARSASFYAFFLVCCFDQWRAFANADETKPEVEADEPGLADEGSTANPTVVEPYGVDVSWPMHYDSSEMNGGLMKEQAGVYGEFMLGCARAYGEETCVHNEEERLLFNRHQPARQTNFTAAGYAKMKMPDEVFDMLTTFWDENKDRRFVESWPEGNIYVNHWDSPTEMVPLGMNFRHATRTKFLQSIREVLEAWSGAELTMTSMYGIRVYKEGSVLSPHVDRLPLVISAILNVAQSGIREDWVLEVVGHDGVAVNVTMERGEMILYESHSVIHGRPYPLKGREYANVFVHFEPVGYTPSLERISEKRTAKENFETALAAQKDVETREAQESGSERGRTQLPPYIKEGSNEASRWLQEFVFHREEKKRESKTKTKTPGVTSTHILAAKGDLDKIKEIAAEDDSGLHKQDGNGWQPIHEAARGGRTNVVKFLIEKGANVNARTNNGKGATPLWWAVHVLPQNHPAIQLLRQHGAVEIGPHE